MSNNVNTQHPLHSNLVRLLKGARKSPFLEDQLGTDHTAPQTKRNIYATAHPSGVNPTQGVAVDGTYWYEINTGSIYKIPLAGGAAAAANTSPFSTLPAGVDHCGDGFELDGYLYIPITDWDSTAQTAVSQTIAVFDTSDLTLYDSFDVSSESGCNLSGISLSQSGDEILGVSYYTLGASNNAQQDVYRWDLSDGTYIGQHDLSNYCVGTQGITCDGEYYYLSSYDTIGSDTRVRVYDLTFTHVNDLYFAGMGATDHIEGIEAYNGKLYSNISALVLREGDISGMYVRYNYTPTPVLFLDNADIGDAGTVVIRGIPAALFNYNSLFDNNDTANDWEAWIYATGEVSWRVATATRNSYTNVVALTQYIMMFSWSKSGSNCTIKLGVDGAAPDSDTGVWVTPPAGGLYLGGKNASNTEANFFYQDVVVFDKQLSDAEWSSLAADYDDLYADPVTESEFINMTRRQSLPLIAM